MSVSRACKFSDFSVSYTIINSPLSILYLPLTLLFLKNFSFLKYFIYLFLERGEGRRKRGRETSMCGCLSWAPYWEPGLQPRPMPWRGMEPATPCFAGWHSIHWATPAKAVYTFFNKMWTYGVRSQESGDQAPGSNTLQSLDLGFGYTSVFTLWEFINCMPEICKCDLCLHPDSFPSGTFSLSTFHNILGQRVIFGIEEGRHKGSN